MRRIILVNPEYYKDIFSNSKVRAAISCGVTPLGLASIASSARSFGHKVMILDLNLADKAQKCLQDTVIKFKPDIVGITSTTPLIKTAYRICEIIKKIDPQILVVAGGPHPTALPEDVIKESKIDVVVAGEGDLTFNSIAQNVPLEDIPGIAYKKDSRIIFSKVNRPIIDNLDSLPFPAYDLFQIKRYIQPRITSRGYPTGNIETSRGCYGKCVFCNKNIHGHRLRMKSPLRVVDEMEMMLGLGFKEIHIIDDLFTADMDRVYRICEEILRRDLRFSWYPRGGGRVDRVSQGLLKIMKSSGCYRIPFGIESGSQRIINIINKNIELGQAEDAICLAKGAGLETECYFMLGLPSETEQDIRKTIDFAIKLNPDYAKFAITIPLPGTQLFDSVQAAGKILTRDWDKYSFAGSLRDIYVHDSLTWEQIENYYHLSHKKFYFRMDYVLRMAYNSLTKGLFLDHCKAFLKTKW